MQVFKRPQFLFDLAEELVWLESRAGADVAEAWFQALKFTIKELERAPYLGRERKDLSPPGIRSWRVSGFARWLIFYSMKPNEDLVFYRIRQGTMNLLVLKMES
jgi:plasmid stabilization system protein ParE